MAAAAPWHRRFEALIAVEPPLPDRATDRAVADALGSGLAVGIVAADPLPAVTGGRSGSADGGAPLFVASADGPDRVAVLAGEVRARPADVDPLARDDLERAVALVRADLGELGIPVGVPHLATHGWAARIAVPALVEGGTVHGEDHVRHVLAAAGLAGRHALVDRLGDVARSASDRVRVRIDRDAVVLSVLDTGDALRWVLEELGAVGIGAADVLVVAAGAPGALPTLGHHEHGVPSPVVVGTNESGPVCEVLAGQVHERARARLPRITPAPGWRLVVGGLDPEVERSRSALVSLADGRVGIGGGSVTGDPSGAWAIMAGVYDGEGPETQLLPGPVATRVPHPTDPTTRAQRTLDLRTGVLHERLGTDAGPIDSVRFACLHLPGTVVLRAAGPPAPGSVPLHPPPEREVTTGEDGEVRWMAVPATSGGIVAAATEARTEADGAATVDRITTYVGDPSEVPDPAGASAGARAAAAEGFDRLLGEHRAAWATRWEDADIEIDGDPDLQLAVRFSLFHLMGSAADEGEAAVGARGLTGPGYRGHVFWDADTFVLPFFAATHPASARAMLEYRIRRLDVALERARREGLRGARFPWESARTGEDVTPRWVRDRAGRVVPIRTGQLEEHIVGQVALAACTYVDWTGDEAFAAGPGLRLLVETARWWASSARRAPDGRAHLFGVIGPDEYHEPVDDNAFTNVLARWNLTRAAAEVEERGADDLGVGAEEVAAWRDLAGALVDGYDPSTGVYEEFARFFDLEPLLIAEVAPRRPIVADLLLGRDRVMAAQVVKQADVLMLHHLLPEEVVPGSLEPNLRYYEPRTAHGSSLSPAIHAALFARVRDHDRALEALHLAARIDLDDLTLTTASGLHVATMGGLWQALVYGFAGLRPRAGHLAVDPRLPPAWSGLGVRVRFLGRRVQVRIEHDRLHLVADGPVGIEVDGRTYTVEPGGLELRRRGPTWEVQT